MKNQNDLIVLIVSIVLTLIASLTFFFTKRVPVQPPEPDPVPITAVQPAPGAVTYATSLPSGGGSSANGFAPGGGGGTPGGFTPRGGKAGGSKPGFGRG